MEYSSYHVNVPQWREITVGSHLPAELRRFAEMAHNLWWTWNEDAKSLYSGLNPELWEEAEQNPVLFLERMDYEELEALTHDGNFMRKMENVYSTFKAYLDVEPDHSRPSVAYFSMEYGLDRVLKIYSGGLGILAGDYLKEASDSNVDLCAVGLLYRYGYFDQALAMDGQQQVHYDPQNFGQLPIEKVMQPDGRQLVIHVPYADSFTVHANVWKANVGRVSLYLLDTDNELNSEFDRPITHHLYGGDWENRLKQEILLGIGGMMTLKVLGIEKDVYHCNEGHARLVKDKKDLRSPSIQFNGVNFLASKTFKKKATGKLERAQKLFFQASSQLDDEELKRRLLEHVNRYGFITRTTYTELTGRLKNKALEDLKRFAKEGIICKVGRGNQMLFVKNQEDSQTEQNI